MRVANAMLLAVNAVLLIVAIAYIVTRGIAAPPTGWDYKDLITILLTVLGAILAALAIFIGIAAVWGYSVLRQAAEEKAAAVADAKAAEIAEVVATRVANQTVGLVAGAGRDDVAERPPHTESQ